VWESMVSPRGAERDSGGADDSPVVLALRAVGEPLAWTPRELMVVPRGAMSDSKWEHSDSEPLAPEGVVYSQRLEESGLHPHINARAGFVLQHPSSAKHKTNHLGCGTHGSKVKPPTHISRTQCWKYLTAADSSRSAIVQISLSKATQP
jgi:hypothetical protein